MRDLLENGKPFDSIGVIWIANKEIMVAEFFHFSSTK